MSLSYVINHLCVIDCLPRTNMGSNKSLLSALLKLKPWIRKDRWMTGGRGGGNVIQFVFVETGVADRWQDFHWLTTPQSSYRLIQHPEAWALWGESRVLWALVCWWSEVRPNRRKREASSLLVRFCSFALWWGWKLTNSILVIIPLLSEEGTERPRSKVHGCVTGLRPIGWPWEASNQIDFILLMVHISDMPGITLHVYRKTAQSKGQKM